MAVATRGYVLTFTSSSVQELLPKPDDNDDFDGVLEVIVRAETDDVYLGGPNLAAGSTSGFKLIQGQEYTFNILSKSQHFLSTPLDGDPDSAIVSVFRSAKL